MELTNIRPRFIGWLTLLICLPYLLSLISLVIEIINCNSESVECWASKRILPFAILYSLLGIAASWSAFKNSKHWKVIVWCFLAISVAMIIYDFYRLPGSSLWESIKMNIYALRVLFEKRNALTFLFWIGKYFLNPIWLVIACTLLLKNNDKTRVRRIQ